MFAEELPNAAGKFAVRLKPIAALMCFGSIEHELSNAVKIMASQRSDRYGPG